MKIIKIILGTLFAAVAFFMMCVAIPVGFIYGALRAGFERGVDLGEDPTQLL